MGATYASQFVSRLKNLSSPARVAIKPMAVRSAVTVLLSRVSMCSLHPNRVAEAHLVTLGAYLARRWSRSGVYGKQSQTVRTSDSSDVDRVSARLARDGVDF